MGYIIKRRPAKGRGNSKNSKKHRFSPGRSGNPRGRPPKKSELPLDVVEALLDALARPRDVQGANGVIRQMNAIQMIAERIVAVIPKAKPNELFKLVTFLDKFNVLMGLNGRAMARDLEDDDGWTEEELAQLAVIEGDFKVTPDRAALRKQYELGGGLADDKDDPIDKDGGSTDEA